MKRGTKSAIVHLASNLLLKKKSCICCKKPRRRPMCVTQGAGQKMEDFDKVN